MSSQQQQRQTAPQSKMAVDNEMKQKLLEALYTTTGFLLTRFPYVWAILLMMTTAELFNTNLAVDKGRLTMSHVHLGAFFLSATAMSFNLFGTKRLFALLTSAQYVVISVQDYMDKNKKETILVRCCITALSVGHVCHTFS